MSMLAILLIVVLSAAFIVLYKQKLVSGRQNCQEAFAALKIALACRHQAARHVVDASQLYLLNAVELNDDLIKACDDAERVLKQSARSVSEKNISRLCRVENKLSAVLALLQNHLDEEMKHRNDENLSSQLEMLEAAESDVINSRRTYNHLAERYNRLLCKLPMGKCATVLGHGETLSLIKFDDNGAEQMSRYLVL